MDKNINFDEIKEAVGANEVLFAQSVGSVLYGVTNPKDDDVLIVVDKMNARWRYYLDDKDIFVITRERYQNGLREVGDRDPLRELCAFINHEAARSDMRVSVYYGECDDRQMSLYDNKKLLFERILKIGDKNFFHPLVHSKEGAQGCSKLMVWALWAYYAFQNGSLQLTDEQQRVIQTCHDGNLPLSEAQELRKKIVSLLEK